MVIVVHRFTAFSSFFPAGCEKWQPDFFFEGTVMSDLVHVMLQNFVVVLSSTKVLVKYLLLWLTTIKRVPIQHCRLF